MSAIAHTHGYPPHWITPQKQLEELVQSETALIKTLTNVLIIDVAKIISTYTFQPNSQLTAWHESLEKIGKLPPFIPPLTIDILQILESPCSEGICAQKKPDGTSYTLGEKCILLLLPEELGSNGEFRTLALAHGAAHHVAQPTLFHCQYALKEFFQDTPTIPTRWVIVTKDILPATRDRSYETQEGLVHALNEGNPSTLATSINWSVPELSQMIKAIFLTKIGTATTLYGSGDTTYTRTINEAMNHRLAIGGWTSKGLKIIGNPNCTALGMGAMGTFRESI